MDGPELFVVCKSCGSEVSPYVTECPYCGQRVRRRAPDLGSDAGSEPARRGTDRRLPRLRRGEIPGIAPDRRPLVTIVLIAVALLATLVLATGAVSVLQVGLVGPPAGEWWRIFTTTFVMAENLGYLFVAMLVVGLFGAQLERRFGPLVPIATFFLCAAAGAELAIATNSYPALGANGAALGMLVAWLVEDRIAAGRGADRGADLVGVVVLALTVALVPLAVMPGALVAGSFAMAAGGAAAGLVIGLLLALLRR